MGLQPHGSWLFALLIPQGNMYNNGITWLSNATISGMFAVSKRGTKKRITFQPGLCPLLPTRHLDEALT